MLTISGCILAGDPEGGLGSPLLPLPFAPSPKSFILSAKPLGLTFKMYPESDPPLGLPTWSCSHHRFSQGLSCFSYSSPTGH